MNNTLQKNGVFFIEKGYSVIILLKNIVFLILNGGSEHV